MIDLDVFTPDDHRAVVIIQNRKGKEMTDIVDEVEVADQIEQITKDSMLDALRRTMDLVESGDVVGLAVVGVTYDGMSTHEAYAFNPVQVVELMGAIGMAQQNFYHLVRDESVVEHVEIDDDAPKPN